ncbi:helix-turn-helix domain-containing protein [bacterium]|nr:MAG: helix-turn-helix domain-containing protein [bacterium]
MQEYRVSNPELIAGLEARGAKVSPVPVYRWALSEDTGPLRSALEEMLAGRVDMALLLTRRKWIICSKLRPQGSRSEIAPSHVEGMAKRLGIDPTTLRLWESGRRRPSSRSLAIIEAFFASHSGSVL